MIYKYISFTQTHSLFLRYSMDIRNKGIRFFSIHCRFNARSGFSTTEFASELLLRTADLVWELGDMSNWMEEVSCPREHGRLLHSPFSAVVL